MSENENDAFPDDLSIEDIQAALEAEGQQRAEGSDLLKTLAVNYRDLRAEKDRLEEEQKKLNARLEEAEFRLVSAMRRMGLSSAKMPEVGQIVLQEKNYSKLNPEHEAEFFALLDKEGDAALIKSVVHPQTLQGWVNKRLAAAAENGTLDQACRELEQYMSIYTKTRPTLRKAK